MDALLALIRSDPTNFQNYLVYADCLQERGDPRGQLIALQHCALTPDSDPNLQGQIDEHIKAHSKELLGPMQQLVEQGSVTATWRLGFIQTLSIAWPIPDEDTYALGSGNLSFPNLDSMVEQSSGILKHPSCILLEKLTLAPVSAMVAKSVLGHVSAQLQALEIELLDWTSMACVVEALVDREWPQLQQLRLAHARYVELAEGGDVTETSWEKGPLIPASILRSFGRATPQLTLLRLEGERFFDGLEHPTLSQLELQGIPLDGCPNDIYPAKVHLPKLQSLKNFAVMDEYRHTPIGELTLTKEHVPGLHTLIFRGHYDEGHADRSLFSTLAHCPILEQLTHVSMPHVVSGSHDEPLSLTSRYTHLATIEVEAVLEEPDEHVGTDLEEQYLGLLPNLRVVGSS